MKYEKGIDNQIKLYYKINIQIYCVLNIQFVRKRQMGRNKKTFTVQDVANILGVDEVTVRRWINRPKGNILRSAKPTETSRKEGWIIKESDIIKFLSIEAQHQKRLRESLAVMGGMLAAEVFARIYRDKKTDVGILESDLRNFINEEIIQMQAEIAHKELEIEKKQNEIEELQTRIKQYELLSNKEMLQETVRRLAKQAGAIDEEGKEE